MNYVVVKKGLKTLKNCSAFAILAESKEKDEKAITLQDVNKQITRKRNVRLATLKAFRNDLAVALQEPRAKSISFNPENLFEDSRLALNLTDDTGLRVSHCLFDSDGTIYSANGFYGTTLEEKIDKMRPFIKSLFAFAIETGLLDNDFYNYLYASVSTNLVTLPYVISGDGIFLDFLDSSFDELTPNEKEKLLKYFIAHYNKILGKILVNEDTILDCYRTDLTKNEAVKIYRGLR